VLSHVDARGAARMVDVGAKPATARSARAAGAIRMSPEAYALVAANGLAKGDVLAVARVAGVMAAKRTAELIPLCHPIALTHADVACTLDPALPGVRVEATARTVGPTGVEMEALTAAAWRCSRFTTWPRPQTRRWRSGRSDCSTSRAARGTTRYRMRYAICSGPARPRRLPEPATVRRSPRRTTWRLPRKAPARSTRPPTPQNMRDGGARVPYARRGDLKRRRERRRNVALLAGTVMAALALAHERAPREAAAAPATALEPVRHPGTLAAAPPRRELERWRRVYRYAEKYGIHTDLARTIHDAAVSEGIEPELGFRLVRVESEFNPRATSRVGAVGLTQLMPGTARHFVPGVTRAELYDPALNARVGFRYLRGLIKEYRSVRLALLVYNRGPVAVQHALAAGEDPANGYERVVMDGYTGRGVLAR
jgi:molybdenum cofactor biosynthesis protein MoaC